jgi:hypothetical protein
MGSFDAALSALPAFSSALNAVGNALANTRTTGLETSDMNFQDVMGAVAEAPAQQSDPTQVGSDGSGYVTTAAVSSSAPSTAGTGNFGGPGATVAQLAILQAGPSASSYDTYVETQNEVAAEQEPGYTQPEFNNYWTALTSGQLASQGGSAQTPAFVAYEGSNPTVVNAELEAAGLAPAFTDLPAATTSTSSESSTSASLSSASLSSAPSSASSGSTSPNATFAGEGSGYVTTAAVSPSAASTAGSGNFGGPGATAAQLAILQAGPSASSYDTYVETQNEVAAEQEPGYNQSGFNSYWSALTSGQLASQGGSVQTPAFVAYEGSNPQVVNAELAAAGLAPAFTNLPGATTPTSSGSSIAT